MAAAQETQAAGERALQLLKEPIIDVLSTLTVLDLKGCGITSLPDAVAQCSKVERLDVGNNPLQDFPDALASMPSLKILFASGAQFSVLPPVLARCAQLRMIGLGNNRLTVVDGESLPADLVWLILAGNQIGELRNMARCQHIRKLMLSHNQLTCEGLASAASISGLEMIRVASNKLEAFPEALLRHPRLSWVAVGGNPFTEAALAQRLATAPASIDYAEVALGDRLGAGAGATVYSAQWKGRDVAVKLWENERFSDGTARGEWAINRVAGHPGHPSIVGVLGTFEEPRAGMVLEKIVGAVQAAAPPSFAPFTVTRDVLPTTHGKPGGPQYTAGAAVAIARSVATAAEYLHGQGILHGDVYLHNTLVTLEGPTECAGVKDVRLSDFGAAAAVDSPGFFKVEARAFGWMLQDLIELIVPSASDDSGSMAATTSLLKGLRERCGSEALEDLPTFSQIVAALNGVTPTPSL